jgi:hypothetical protein
MQLRPQIHFAQREKIIPIITISVHLRSREAKPEGGKGKAKIERRKSEMGAWDAIFSL